MPGTTVVFFLFSPSSFSSPLHLFVLLAARSPPRLCWCLEFIDPSTYKGDVAYTEYQRHYNNILPAMGQL